MSGCNPSTFNVRPFYCFGAYYLVFFGYLYLFSFYLRSFCLGLSLFRFSRLIRFPNFLVLSPPSLDAFGNLLYGLPLSLDPFLTGPDPLLLNPLPPLPPLAYNKIKNTLGLCYLLFSFCFYLSCLLRSSNETSFIFI